MTDKTAAALIAWCNATGVCAHVSAVRHRIAAAGRDPYTGQTYAAQHAQADR